MQHTTWMEPQSTQGGNNQHTTNQETNNLKRVNEGGSKVTARFCISLRISPYRAKRGSCSPQVQAGPPNREGEFQLQTSMRSPDSMPRSAGSSLPESFVPSKKKESLWPESPMASS